MLLYVYVSDSVLQLQISQSLQLLVGIDQASVRASVEPPVGNL